MLNHLSLGATITRPEMTIWIGVCTDIATYVENAFLKIKKYRAIASRYDKLARNFYSMVSLPFSMMWLPMWVD